MVVPRTGGSAIVPLKVYSAPAVPAQQSPNLGEAELKQVGIYILQTSKND